MREHSNHHLDGILLVALAIAAWVWASGEVAGALASGRWPPVAPLSTLSVIQRLSANLGDPRLAWPAPASRLLPGPEALYLCAAMLMALAVAAAAVALRRPRRRSARGARWARRADLAPVRVGTRSAKGRLVLGRAGRRLVATEARHSVLVLGPTQSGKTSGLAIPALLEWDGPLVATSVKDDLAKVTYGWRSRSGPCWVFDPTRASGLSGLARWSPLSACATWSGSQKVATWLVEATPARAGMADAAFWYAAAAKQLAPLLLAAERGGVGIAAVARWTNACEFDEPMRLLELAGEPEAVLALAACSGRDERIRSSVATTVETVLAPFEDPLVADSTSASDVDIQDLLATSGTLYLCGPSHEQQRVQGLFATMVSSLVAAALERVAEIGRPLDPPLLVVLDEAANIAPIRDLDTLASTGAGCGIQLVTVCQDLSQLSARYGTERARTIANNHRAKLLLSGVSDLTTLDLLSGLAGEAAVREESFTRDLRDGRATRSSATAFRRLAPTDELRRISPGEGVLVYGHLPPARLELRPWYSDRGLRRRVLGLGLSGAAGGDS